jgi:TolB protein
MILGKITVALIVLFWAVPAYAQEAVVEDIRWDKDKHCLSYVLSRDSLVRIRIGQEGRALYRTLVNLGKRTAGRNQEYWDGRDESAKINLLEYGSPHFCINSFESAEDKDLELEASINGGPPGLKPGVPFGAESRPASIRSLKTAALWRRDKGESRVTIDLGEADKISFMKEGAELKVYLDNRLILTERISALPYAFSLPCGSPSEGKQLLCVNLWQRPEFKSCAYKTVEISQSRPLSGKIAFCQLCKDYWQVWTAGLNGKAAKVLTSSPVDKRYPCFSPDGRRIAYTTNTGELWVMDSDGKNNRRIELPINCYEPKWSPDGKKIAFTSYEDLFRSNTKIWILDLAGGNLQKIANRPFLQYSPSWSPDGKSIIFIDGPELYAQQIRRIDLDTGEVTQITDNSVYVYEAQPSYLPDGRGVIYSSNEAGDYDIWLMAEIGPERKNLTRSHSHDTFAAVSRDGQNIFFLSDKTGLNEVWQMDIDGQNLRQVTRAGQGKRDLAIWTE